MRHWKNSMYRTDDELDHLFNVQFHVSELGGVFTDKGVLHRNPTNEYGLKLLSARYGEDSFGFSLHPKMAALKKELEDRFGVAETEEVPFLLRIETSVANGIISYFIAAGNNGQELSSGFYLSDETLLDDREAITAMKEIDKAVFGIVQKHGISDYGALRQ
ncbi:hypothetical protein IMZ31_23650 (plasmid) [Pontibacillus sp. ALD_SL1]|uniref:hypothetical protein n=1 Tax=Pontibacillus sp. ALD_SL1 TaxID=2777185 RepID=UPI001A95F0BD|nr:hypothetical protein [Pontibacillus sp. ALD_SL1]QST02447.1 hypothetical protein IMZ31_23650 [Pontibacillus sp. ALD_SL1]